jgi:nucleotide-binding universal stress UspA family protein
MYQKILVTLDATETDRAILEHIKGLARLSHSRLVLLHVADGWAARWFGNDAISQEITDDRAYLNRVEAELSADGFQVESDLAFGNPADEIVKWVKGKGCDLIAMSTHGHRFLADLMLGTTASRVQHQVDVPVLLLRAKVTAPSSARQG